MKAKLSDEIFENLKQRIMLNQIRPGEKLSEELLVNDYHVSRTPARQALQRLEALGLVEIRDGVGSFVTVISPQDMRDAYDIRRMAEMLAIETSVDRISGNELDQLEERFLHFQEQLEKGGYGVFYEDMIRTDWALHDLIIGRSDNRLLPMAIEQATMILRRYQFIYITQYQRATKEHLRIVRAIKEKNFEELRLVLNEHLRLRPI